MSCGKHTTRRQAHATRRAKGSHTVRKASHQARRQSTTNKTRKAVSAHVTHRQVRAIRKARPKAAKASSPRKRTKGKQGHAQLKARNRRSRILSARARTNARAIATAKVRAAQKAAAARRPSHKTTRSHAKHHRFYCQVGTRRAATVKKAASPVAPVQKRAVRPVKVSRSPKPSRAVKAARK